METNSIKVLIVEDEAIIAERLYADLTDYGYHVLEPCFDPAAALQSLGTEQPDIVLIDIKLNDAMDGIDLGAVINSRYGLPFIFVTGNTDDAMISQALRVQPRAFLAKPVQLHTLIGTIQVAIYNHQHNRLPGHSSLPVQYHFIKNGNQYLRVDWTNVTHVESDKKYARVFEQGNKVPYVLKISLELLAQHLAAFQFVRIHKSWLVNLAHVTAISGQDITLSSNIVLPLGEKYKAAFARRLTTYQ